MDGLHGLIYSLTVTLFLDVRATPLIFSINGFFYEDYRATPLSCFRQWDAHFPKSTLVNKGVKSLFKKGGGNRIFF